MVEQAADSMKPPVLLKTRKDPQVGLALGLHTNTNPNNIDQDGGFPYNDDTLPRVEVCVGLAIQVVDTCRADSFVVSVDISRLTTQPQKLLIKRVLGGSKSLLHPNNSAHTACTSLSHQMRSTTLSSSLSGAWAKS